DLKRGGIQLVQVGGNAVDARQAAVEVFQIGDHDFVPQVALFEIANQVVVHHGEFARQVRLDVQVAVVRLDAWRHADNIRYRCGGRNGHAVGVAHAVLADVGSQCIPIQCAAVVHFNV